MDPLPSDESVASIKMEASPVKVAPAPVPKKTTGGGSDILAKLQRQRELKKAIKRARHMGFLPFVG